VTHLTISGQTILRRSGRPFLAQGFCYGHAELIQRGDIAESRMMGANICRLVVRLWGDYGVGFQEDWQDADLPGHLRVCKLEMLRWQIEEARSCGLRILLAFDSDCGQGTGGEKCCGEDFFTPGGQAQLALFIETIQFLLTEFRGVVDFVEPLVEPRSAHATKESVWPVQEEIMRTALAVDPTLLFIIGAYPAYWPSALHDAYDPTWAEGPLADKIILTADLLSDLVCGDPEHLAERLTSMTRVGAELNLPIIIQQVGSMSSGDPDDSKLAAVLAQLAARGMGAIVWEHTSLYEGSYGVYWLSNVKQVYSPRVQKPARMAMLRGLWE